MAYERVNWENLPSIATPVNATNLNKMDLGIKENSNIIGGDAYDSTATYNVGDYCIYNNTLYQCKTKIATAEAWNSSHWVEVTIINQLGEHYSLTELVVGTWIDGKPLYKKTKDIGWLPNNSTKTVSLDLPSNSAPVKMEGYFSTGGTFANLPYYSSQAQYVIDFWYENGSIKVTTYRNRTDCYGRAFVYYIKTDD